MKSKSLTLLFESKEIQRKTKQKYKSTIRNLTRKQNYFHILNLATSDSSHFLYSLNKKIKIRKKFNEQKYIS